MENYSNIITKVRGETKPVISLGKTIAGWFAEAFRGESITGYRIRVGGQCKEASYVPLAGENVTVAKMDKGN